MKPFLVLSLPVLLLSGCVAVPYDSGEVYYPAPAIRATISSGHHHHHGAFYPAPHVHPAPVIVTPRHPHRHHQPPGAHAGHGHRQPHLQDRGGSGWQYRDAPRRRDSNGHFRGNRGGRHGGYHGGHHGR